MYLENDKCIEICGKGKKLTDNIECDDGNLEEGDGCNSKCEVEKNWECEEDTKGKSICMDMSEIEIFIDTVP